MKDERFSASLAWDGQSGARAQIGDFPRIRLDMPHRFGGKERYPCPDELFLASIAGCLLTTFLYFKKKMRVNVKSVDISISSTLTTRPEGYGISGLKATMYARSTKEDKANARRCINLAIEYCHITRSLEKAIPIHVTGRVHVVK